MPFSNETIAVDYQATYLTEKITVLFYIYSSQSM